MRLNPNLLSSVPGFPYNPDDLYAVLNAHGLYNSRHFVLRLLPEVHRKLSKFSDVKFRTNVDFDTAQAMSTYLHETIHWWQHIGSTTGLMLSLIFSVHEHANHNYLLRLLTTTGPKKSLRQLSELMPETLGHGKRHSPHFEILKWQDSFMDRISRWHRLVHIISSKAKPTSCSSNTYTLPQEVDLVGMMRVLADYSRYLCSSIRVLSPPRPSTVAIIN